jgi:hypothetical protein
VSPSPSTSRRPTFSATQPPIRSTPATRPSWKRPGLAERFPPQAALRHIAIELLAEREAVENLLEDPSLIEDAIDEALHILEERR